MTILWIFCASKFHCRYTENVLTAYRVFLCWGSCPQESQSLTSEGSCSFFVTVNIFLRLTGSLSHTALINSWPTPTRHRHAQGSVKHFGFKRLGRLCFFLRCHSQVAERLRFASRSDSHNDLQSVTLSAERSPRF